MKPLNPLSRVIGLLALTLSSCIAPIRSDIRTTEEPPGANCQYGGLKVETGHDENKNGRLDTAEVMDTDYVCNQRVDGKTSLISVGVEAPGANCEQGGVKILVGLDDDDDRVLDA